MPPRVEYTHVCPFRFAFFWELPSHTFMGAFCGTTAALHLSKVCFRCDDLHFTVVVSRNLHPNAKMFAPALYRKPFQFLTVSVGWFESMSRLFPTVSNEALNDATVGADIGLFEIPPAPRICAILAWGVSDLLPSLIPSLVGPPLHNHEDVIRVGTTNRKRSSTLRRIM